MWRRWVAAAIGTAARKAAPPAAIATSGGRRRRFDARIGRRQAAFLDFATWVAMASINAGDRQS